MSPEFDNTMLAEQKLVVDGAGSVVGMITTTGAFLAFPNPLTGAAAASAILSAPVVVGLDAVNAGVAGVTFPVRFAGEQISQAYFRPRRNVVGGQSPLKGFYDVGMSAGERKLKSQMDYEALLQEQEDYDAAQAEPLYYVDDEGNYYYY